MLVAQEGTERSEMGRGRECGSRGMLEKDAWHMRPSYQWWWVTLPHLMSSTIPLMPYHAVREQLIAYSSNAVMFGGMMSYQQLIGNHHCTCGEWYHYHHPYDLPFFQHGCPKCIPKDQFHDACCHLANMVEDIVKSRAMSRFAKLLWHLSYILLTSLHVITEILLLFFLQTNMLLVKANGSKSCHRPLVATKSEISWYPYVDGCGLQCENVLFTETDHARAHVFIAVTGSVCFFCTLFAVVLCCFFQILNNMVLRTLFCSISIVLHTLCRKSKAFDFSS